MKHLLLVLFCFSLPAQALDFVTTHDGGHITGQINHITDTTIVIQTDYAGEITIQRDKVSGFSTQQLLSVRLQDETTITGYIEQYENNQLLIKHPQGQLITSLQNIAESWSPLDTDPRLVRIQQKQQAEARHWSYQANLDLTGKEGNSDEFGLNLGLAAELKGQKDSLKIYANIDQAERDGEDSSDEIIVGAEYNAYTNDPWGWYLRAQLEKDEFENLDLRTLLGAGVNYRVFHSPDHSLELRSGLAYRHEKFKDGNTEQAPSLDFGLIHDWQFADWGKMTNKLTYTPAIDDFGDYLLTHDSGIEIPLGLSDQWQLKLGLQNDYTSMPAEDRKHLDTSYYSRLQLNWE